MGTAKSYASGIPVIYCTSSVSKVQAFPGSTVLCSKRNKASVGVYSDTSNAGVIPEMD